MRSHVFVVFCIQLFCYFYLQTIQWKWMIVLHLHQALLVVIRLWSFLRCARLLSVLWRDSLISLLVLSNLYLLTCAPPIFFSIEQSILYAIEAVLLILSVHSLNHKHFYYIFLRYPNRWFRFCQQYSSLSFVFKWAANCFCLLFSCDETLYLLVQVLITRLLWLIIWLILIDLNCHWLWQLYKLCFTKG